MVLHVSEFPSCFRLNNIPLYGGTTFKKSIPGLFLDLKFPIFHDPHLAAKAVASLLHADGDTEGAFPGWSGSQSPRAHFGDSLALLQVTWTSGLGCSVFFSGSSKKYVFLSGLSRVT